MMKYTSIKSMVMKELNDVLDSVDNATLELVCIQLKKCLLNNGSVIGLGAGRMGYSLKAFIMRLSHLGFHTYMIGDTSLPRITDNDLVIVNSSSGETPTIALYTKQALEAGSKIITFTTDKESSIAKMSDTVVKYDSPDRSMQFMKTLYEQSTFVLFDILTQMLIELLNIDENIAQHNHSILE